MVTSSPSSVGENEARAEPEPDALVSVCECSEVGASPSLGTNASRFPVCRSLEGSEEHKGRLLLRRQRALDEADFSRKQQPGQTGFEPRCRDLRLCWNPDHACHFLVEKVFYLSHAEYTQ